MTSETDSLSLVKLMEQIQVHNENEEEHWISEDKNLSSLDKIPLKKLIQSAPSTPRNGDPDNNVREPMKIQKNSRSITESLNLESNWRPKKGNFKLPNLSQVQRFPRIHESDPHIEELQATVDHLDEQINYMSSLFMSEKLERIKVQNELRTEIEGSPTISDNNKLFLDICRINNETDCPELKNNNNNQEAAAVPKNKPKINGRNFILRNIQLAKQKYMGNRSLTDEEKQYLKELLEDIDTLEDDESIDDSADMVMNSEGSATDTTTTTCTSCTITNAYELNEDDRNRINEIDSYLEQFDACQIENYCKSLEEIDKRLEELEKEESGDDSNNVC